MPTVPLSDSGSTNHFVKGDTGKARPSLIPVEFRRGLRFADEYMRDLTTREVSLNEMYLGIEMYEQGAINGPVHPLIESAYVLQHFFNTNWGGFLMGVARVMTMGARKYSPDNWKQCPFNERHRYVDAFYRHTLAFEDGEMLDPESGEHHLLHAACCLAMLHGIDFIEHNTARFASKDLIDKVADQVTEMMESATKAPHAQTQIDLTPMESGVLPASLSKAHDLVGKAALYRKDDGSTGMTETVHRAPTASDKSRVVEALSDPDVISSGERPLPEPNPGGLY